MHSNGFSLVRKLLADCQLALDSPLPGTETNLGTALLAPTRIYAQPILKLLESIEVHGMAHITGGGLPGNVPRMLPDGVGAVLQRKAWPMPPVLSFLQNIGGFTPQDLDPVFNQGLGFVIFGQLCSRRFSWQLFALVAAVLSAMLGRMYEAMGMDALAL